MWEVSLRLILANGLSSRCYKLGYGRFRLLRMRRYGEVRRRCRLEMWEVSLRLGPVNGLSCRLDELGNGRLV